jgi:hypothetical protein
MQPVPRQSRSRRWLWWLLGGALAMLLMCVAIGGYGVWALSRIDLLGATLEDELDRAQIAQLIEADLPPSTAHVRSYYTQFQDYFACIRFEIDPADLEVFVASTPFPQPLQRSNDPAVVSTSCTQPWWQADQAHTLLWATRPVGSGAETLIIDISDPQRMIVYWNGYST